MKISAVIKGSICLLGLVAVGNVLAAPAQAGPASARGAATVVRMNGSSISVSGELTAPSGMYYGGALIVSPAGTLPGDNTETIFSLLIDPGAPTGTATASANPVVAAVAAAITNAAGNLSDEASLIRAAGGSTGFTALD
ncbi:hypothetical protein [Nostoc sp. CCY0012]|uniref:hypothetical protein n=1 Tax=Nostoc sp. CCY0012 TaxID=1056123 RepID=UPI0039C69868